ncbi:MAG: hypothetical protein RIB98_00245 [Acidimicrobiales bacterium]
MLRRKPQAQPAAPIPEWQQRFDAAAELIRSRPQPPWLDDRLQDLQRALTDTHAAQQQLDNSLDQLGVDQTASELKAALRDRRYAGPGADRSSVEKRIDRLRHRFDAVNDMANRRDLIARQLVDTVADVELLAVQAVHASTLESRSDDDLSEHLERLDIDLRSLELARREIEHL